MITVLERTLPHLIAVGDIIETSTKDGPKKERVTELKHSHFVTVPAGRRKHTCGGGYVHFYADLVR